MTEAFLPDHGGAEIRREFPLAPLVGVGGVVVRNGQVLLVRRSNPPAKDEWAIPGGLIELGEGMRDALERELREECGIEAEAGPPIEVFDRIESAEDGSTHFHYVIIDFLVTSFRGEPVAGSDVADVRWVSPSDLAALGITKPVRRLIEYAVEASKS